MHRFQNKTCVVTGAARGIGRACVEQFVAEGGRVAMLDLPASLEHVADLPEGVVPIACDVTVRAQVERAFEESLALLGPADVCVSNAGVWIAEDFLAMDDATFDRLLDVNTRGVFITGQVAGRQMVAHERAGAIVNMASAAAFLSGGNLAGYSATKGAVVALTKGMSVALAPYGVRVNAVAPGTIATEMTAGALDPVTLEGVRLRTPAGRVGTAAEVAAAVAHLCSDEASYITGHCQLVDGGRTALNHLVPQG